MSALFGTRILLIYVGMRLVALKVVIMTKSLLQETSNNVMVSFVAADISSNGHITWFFLTLKENTVSPPLQFKPLKHDLCLP